MGVITNLRKGVILRTPIPPTGLERVKEELHYKVILMGMKSKYKLFLYLKRKQPKNLVHLEVIFQ